MRTRIITPALVAVLGMWIGACADTGGRAIGPPGESFDDPEAWKVVTGDEATAQALTRYTGRPHTAEDVRRMGDYAEVVLKRHYIEEDERDLAALRALRPESGSLEAERIVELELGIKLLRMSLSSRLSDLAHRTASQDGCFAKPDIWIPLSKVRVHPGGRLGVWVSGEGDHETRGRNNQFVYTQIKIKNERRGNIVKSIGRSQYDGTCAATRSPPNRVELHVPKDLLDFEHLCAFATTEHKADNGYESDEDDSRDPLTGCKNLSGESSGGPGNPILH